VIAGTLKDGFGIEVSFGIGESTTNHANVTLYIDPDSITPPGIDGGDAIDTTTHTNSALRTKHARSLQDITDGACTVVYDPDAWTSIVALVNDNVLITFTFPTGDTLAFFGYLKSFIPNEYVEGEQATAECVLVVTNRDHSDDTETLPEYTLGS
jgi:hypothetical protein